MMSCRTHRDNLSVKARVHRTSVRTLSSKPRAQGPSLGLRLGTLKTLPIRVFRREPRLYKRVCPSVGPSVGPSVRNTFVSAGDEPANDLRPLFLR